jgi:hypothetical protein
MRNDPPELIVIYALAGISLTGVALWFSHWYTERRLQDWARGKGYELLRWRGALPWQGPRAWRRWRHQQDYRVEIRDRRGLRSGWLQFDWPWIGMGTPRIRAKWDGCMEEDTLE